MSEASLWREPDRVVKLPVPFVFMRGQQRHIVEEVELDGIDGWCEDTLADDSGNREQKKDRLNEVLSRCTVWAGKSGDPEGQLKIPVGQERRHLPKFFSATYDEMPLVNRVFMLVRLRQLSVHDPTSYISGHKYTFSMTCPHCKKLSEGYYVMLNELEVVYHKGPPIEPDQVFSLNHPMGAVEWRVVRGKDDPAIAQAVEDTRGDRASALLYQSVVSVNGQPLKTLAALKDLKKQVRAAVTRATEDIGGIDVSLVLECMRADCGKEFSSRLPVGQKGFFSPSPEPRSGPT